MAHGKSSLIKCIVGLNKGYSGKIEINEDVSYLPQRMNIKTDFPASIKEVVLSGTIVNNVKSVFYTKANKIKANEIMKTLGLYEIKNKSFAELSGGQQQRVLIARALCGKSKLLILDEPTNGLDQDITKQIYKLLGMLKHDLDLTIIMVSHDIDRALKCADNVIEISDGKIKYNGTAQKYLAGGDK